MFHMVKLKIASEYPPKNNENFKLHLSIQLISYIMICMGAGGEEVIFFLLNVILKIYQVQTNQWDGRHQKVDFVCIRCL